MWVGVCDSALAAADFWAAVARGFANVFAAADAARGPVWSALFVCANVLAAADFAALLALELPNVLPAADAAREPVCRVFFAMLITSLNALVIWREW